MVKRKKRSSRKAGLPVRCDSCGKQFRPNVEHRPLPAGGEWVMFECPYCRKQYTVARTTKRGKAIRDRMVAIRAQLVGLKGMVGGDVILKRERLLAEYEGLRGEMEHEVAT